MIITSIKKIKTLYYISIDSIPTLIITDEAQYKLKFKIGDEFKPDEDTLNILKEDEILRCKSKAFNILSNSNKSEKYLREKLKNNNFNDYAVDATIKYLIESNYLNDFELGEMILRKEYELKKSKNQIKQKLYNKGISKENIQNLMENADIDENVNAFRIAQKKYDTIKKNKINDIIKKIRNSLLYRGFSYEAINYSINKIKKIYGNESDDND